jgi:hypothetical protein
VDWIQGVARPTILTKGVISSQEWNDKEYTKTEEQLNCVLRDGLKRQASTGLMLVLYFKNLDMFKQISPGCVVNTTRIKSISVQTQLNSIYYIVLHVSTYLRSSSGSQLVFKTCSGSTHNIYFFLKKFKD